MNINGTKWHIRVIPYARKFVNAWINFMCVCKHTCRLHKEEGNQCVRHIDLVLVSISEINHHYIMLTHVQLQIF